MRYVVLAAIITSACFGASAKEWKCRGESDKSFTAEDRKTIRAAREFAEQRSGRRYTCFDFGPESKDGARFVHMDGPTKRDGTPIAGIGSSGSVLLDKNGHIVKYEGGR